MTARIPKFTAPALKPGPKPKAELVAVAKRMGRPPNAVKAKLEEINARLVLSHSDQVMKQMLKALNDSESPSHGLMLKFFGDRLFNMANYQEEQKVKPNKLTIEIVDIEGNMTRVTSRGGDAEDEPVPLVLEMEDPDEN